MAYIVQCCECGMVETLNLFIRTEEGWVCRVCYRSDESEKEEAAKDG